MTTALERSLDSAPQPRPTLLRGVVFRFAFAYWTLFCLPLVVTQIVGFEWLGRAIGQMWGAVAVWVGKSILAIPYEFSPAENGSGDKTVDWVMVLCIACLALIATVVWSLVDRRRAHDARLRELLRVLVRYALAFIMLDYGVLKLCFGQFPSPNAGRLLQRYGDSSPMGLLWTFMGASPAYVFFSGAAETLGALLLLFRRTTTLGALVLAGVLTNVVMLNFCYDVPVKINSSHYLAMAGFLLLPDLGRLANVFVFDRATQPAARDLVLPKRWMRVARPIVKYGVIAVVLVTAIQGSAGDRSGADPTTWYGGYWTVTAFARDGRDLPAVITDATRWRTIRFQRVNGRTYLRWRFMNDAYGDLYTVAVDDEARTMTLAYDAARNAPGRSAPPAPARLTYVRGDADHFRLEGKIGADSLAIELERLDPGDMLLVTRGFHWINEQPFNR